MLLSHVVAGLHCDKPVGHKHMGCGADVECKADCFTSQSQTLA